MDKDDPTPQFSERAKGILRIHYEGENSLRMHYLLSEPDLNKPPYRVDWDCLSLRKIEKTTPELFKGHTSWEKVHSLFLFLSPPSNSAVRTYECRKLYQMLQRKLNPSTLVQLKVVVSVGLDTAMDDKLLSALPEYFPNIRRLTLTIRDNGVNERATPLPITSKSVAKFKRLSHLKIDGWFLPNDCCFNLADSIEGLPLLKRFHMDDWIVEKDDYQSGLEALFGALYNHPNADINRSIIYRSGKQFCREHGIQPFPVPPFVTKILAEGLNAKQKVQEMNRKGRLPKGFPKDNQFKNGTVNPMIWLEAMIQVKEIPDDGEEMYRFLHEQLTVDAVAEGMVIKGQQQGGTGTTATTASGATPTAAAATERLEERQEPTSTNNNNSVVQQQQQLLQNNKDPEERLDQALLIARQEEVVSDSHSVTSRTSIGMSGGNGGGHHGRGGGGSGGGNSTEVEELRAQVESLKQQLLEREQQLLEREQQLLERDSAVNALKQQLAQRLMEEAQRLIGPSTALSESK